MASHLYYSARVRDGGGDSSVHGVGVADSPMRRDLSDTIQQERTSLRVVCEQSSAPAIQKLLTSTPTNTPVDGSLRRWKAHLFVVGVEASLLGWGAPGWVPR